MKGIIAKIEKRLGRELSSPELMALHNVARGHWGFSEEYIVETSARIIMEASAKK